MSSLTKMILASTTAAVASLAPCGFADDAPRLPLTGHLSNTPMLEIPGVSSYELAEIEIPKNLPDRATIQVPIDGVTRTIELYHYSLRSLDFELYEDRGEGLILLDAPEPRTYRGSVAGLENSSVRSSFLDSGLVARIDLGDDLGVWWVQPISTLEPDGVVPPPGSTEKTHVILPGASGVFLPGYFCGNDIYEMGEPENNGGNDGGLAGDIAGNRLTRIAACADYEYFQQNSSSVNSTLNDIETMISFYESVYEQAPASGGVELNFELSATVVHSNSNDPYSSQTADGILCEFRARWNSGEEDDIERDLAQIFTGKNVSGNVLGIAWLGVACNLYGTDCGVYNNMAYSMVESKYTSNYTLRTSLGAHEIGHNYGSGHCDNYSWCEIMCSGNGGCIYPPNDFGSGSRTTIINHINSTSCDTALGEAIELPFFEEFNTISTTTWIFNKGCTTSTSAANEPSPSRSLQLDATGSGTYAANEIRSRSMNASGADSMFVSFYTQFRGVDAGEGLLVEYVNSANDWVELDQIISSDGATESEFTYHEYEMGADAKTSRFRIRFVALVNSSSDDIYVDDLRVGPTTEPPVDPPANDGCIDAQLVAAGTTFYTTEGATSSAEPGCDGIQQDVWFYFVTGTAGTATVTLCGSSTDTEMAVYNGLVGCPYQEAHLIECQDNSSECGDDPYVQFSTADYPAVYIRAGGNETGADQILTISVQEDEEECLGDLDGNGQVDGADLSICLGAWNGPEGDLNDDGNTDGADLSIILGAWGLCP